MVVIIVMQLYLKYLIESFGIALAGKLLLGGKINFVELITITLTITSTLFILDRFAPEIGASARQGTGFGLGMNMVGGNAESKQESDSNKTVPIPKPTYIEDSDNADANTNTRNVPTMVIDRTPQVNILGRQQTDRDILTFYGRSRCESVTDGLNRNQETIEGFVGGDGSGDNSAIYSNYQSGPGVTASQQGLVYGKLMDVPTKGHLARIKESVYSGDLLDIKIKGAGLYLVDGSDFIRVSTDEGLDNKLLKLRFELATGHRVDKLVPLNYQDAMYIIFTGHDSKPRKLNHNGELNSLESSDRYTLFELVNADEPNSKRSVNFSDNILIRRVLEGEKNVYLKEDTKTKKVSVSNPIKDASRFRIYPKKGCGPLWRFDSDTRTTNLFNSSQIRDVLEARTTSIRNQLQQLREENAVLRAQRDVPSDVVIDISNVEQVQTLAKPEPKFITTEEEAKQWVENNPSITWGGSGNYSNKGFYVYKSDHPEHANTAWWGKGGDDKSIVAPLNNNNIYRPTVTSTN